MEATGGPAVPLIACSTLAPGGQQISTEADLSALLSAVEKHALEDGAPQYIEMSFEDDEDSVFALMLDPENSRWGVISFLGEGPHYALNGTGSTEPVSVQYGDSWELVEAQCFIDPAVALRAAVQFLESKTLSSEIHWADA